MSTISSPLPVPPNRYESQLTASLAVDALSFTLTDSSAEDALPVEGVGVLYKKDQDGNVEAGSVEFIHFTGVTGGVVSLTDINDRDLDGSDSGAQAYAQNDYFGVWVTSQYYQSLKDGMVTLTGSETLTNKTLTSPKVTTGINDSGDNELIKVTATASAVNEITLANAATGGNPTITASGGDTNIGLNIVPKGTGKIQFNAGATAPYITARARVFLNANSSGITDSTFTKVALDNESYDTGANFASNKFTVPVTGYYMVTGCINWGSVTGLKRYATLIYVDGSAAVSAFGTAALAVQTAVVAADIIYLTATQYVELYGYHEAGNNNPIFSAGTSNTYLAVHLLST